MKKTLFFAVALVALSSCAKMVTDSNPNVVANQEIKFQTATYGSPTKAGETSYTGGAFGVYAWSEASQLSGNIFMNDETVSNDSGAWKASKTYYWPKTATVDFIAYAPKAKAPAITQTSVKYTDYDLNVSGNNLDLLYSDKAIGYGTNADDVTPGTNNGVPIVFHHALAKLSIESRLAYDRKKQAEADGTYTVTKWAVKILGASSANIAMKGGVELELANPLATSGIVGWLVKDTDSDDPQIWTPDATAPGTLNISLSDALLSTASATSLVSPSYVIPQSLSTVSGSAQAVSFNYEIQTFRKSGLTSADADTYLAQDIVFYEGTGTKPADLFLIEDSSTSANLKLTSIENFEMAHNYKYILIFTPTQSTGNDSGDPDDPADADDPDLDDATITFDPADAGWTDVTASGTIRI